MEIDNPKNSLRLFFYEKKQLFKTKKGHTPNNNDIGNAELVADPDCEELGNFIRDKKINERGIRESTIKRWMVQTEQPTTSVVSERFCR